MVKGRLRHRGEQAFSKGAEQTPKQPAHHNGNRVNCIAESALAVQKRKQQRQLSRAAFVVFFFNFSDCAVGSATDSERYRR